MTAAGWIFLILSWGMIISLTALCFIRVIKSIKKEKLEKVNEKS
jgi:hypothetical protein